METAESLTPEQQEYHRSLTPEQLEARSKQLAMFSHNQKTLNLLAHGILEDHEAEKLWKDPGVTGMEEKHICISLLLWEMLTPRKG